MEVFDNAIDLFKKVCKMLRDIPVGKYQKCFEEWKKRCIEVNGNYSEFKKRCLKKKRN